MKNSAAPVAVLDVGSNTIRLLVAETDGKRVTTVLDRSAFARLGRDVDRTGRLRDDRMDAGVEAIRGFASEARAAGADGLTAIATSAVRDAENGPDFVRRVREQTGVEIRIISGEEEADLTFRGATIDVPLDDGVMVCDLGGGSAELIFADQTGIRWGVSEKLGSGRLTERFVHHDPPEREELDTLAGHIRDVLNALPEARAKTAVFTGGTASHVGIVLGERQGAILPLTVAQLTHVVEMLASRSSRQVVEEFEIQPERAEVLPAGARALQAIAEFYAAQDLIISRRGIREGAVLAAVSEPHN